MIVYSPAFAVAFNANLTPVRVVSSAVIERAESSFSTNEPRAIVFPSTVMVYPDLAFQVAMSEMVGTVPS